MDGAPGLVDRVFEGCLYGPGSHEWLSFLDVIKESVDNGSNFQIDSREFAVIEQIYAPDEHREVQRVVDAWNRLTTEQRAVAYRSINSLDEKPVPWFLAEGVPEMLVQENDSWADLSLSLSALDLLPQPQSAALHGILLPAGFLSWKPMIGSSIKLSMLGVHGGVQMDIRGSNAPTPAASRLFIGESESQKVIVSFIRACLRHALELMSGNLDDPNWREWMDSMCGSVRRLPFWSEAVETEYELLEALLGYAVWSNGHITYCSRQQVIDRYGQWVPISHYTYIEGELSETDGLKRDGATGLLLAFHSTRKTGDGNEKITEADIESFVVPS